MWGDEFSTFWLEPEESDSYVLVSHNKKSETSPPQVSATKLEKNVKKILHIHMDIPETVLHKTKFIRCFDGQRKAAEGQTAANIKP